jgi:hypothetical protein
VTAKLLAIERRRKVHPAAAASPADFAVHQVGSLDRRQLVEDPTLSLYSLDPVERAALFVRTPPEIDLSRAPFLWHAQFTHATELVSVPFHELTELAQQVPSSLERVVFVHSTGRCGSTLASLALAEADGVVALSEPDVFIQLQRQRDRGDREALSLLEACTILLFVPRAARTSVIKFRSQNIELAEPLMECFPGAKTVFLYRQAESWARSAVRAFGLFSSQVLALWDRFDDIQPRVRSSVDTTDLPAFPSPVEFLGWMWATPMARATIMQRKGVPMFTARYEELSQRPLEVLSALCEFCDVRIAPEALRAVVARDSQEGTEHSRSRALEPGSELTDDRLAAFMACLRELAPFLDPHLPIEGTYGT